MMCQLGVGPCDVACDGATATTTMALETTPTNADVMTPNVRIEAFQASSRDDCAFAKYKARCATMSRASSPTPWMNVDLRRRSTGSPNAYIPGASMTTPPS